VLQRKRAESSAIYMKILNFLRHESLELKLKLADVSEKHIATIFKVDEKAETAICFRLVPSLTYSFTLNI
jgi:hypothetical protein